MRYAGGFAIRRYQLIREYLDSAISGNATEKRVAFQQMPEDARQGKFKAVLCWDQDRFGRFDPIEAGYWIKPFRDAGVKLVTVGQGIVDWDTFTGRLTYFVQQEGKHASLTRPIPQCLPRDASGGRGQKNGGAVFRLHHPGRPACS